MTTKLLALAAAGFLLAAGTAQAAPVPTLEICAETDAVSEAATRCYYHYLCQSTPKGTRICHRKKTCY